MLVVAKEASTLSTLHEIANCVKNETRTIVSSNRYQRLARCSVPHIYSRSSLRILFTVFLETKTQLWKLLWAISGCCISSSGSPLQFAPDVNEIFFEPLLMNSNSGSSTLLPPPHFCKILWNTLYWEFRLKWLNILRCNFKNKILFDKII